MLTAQFAENPPLSLRTSDVDNIAYLGQLIHDLPSAALQRSGSFHCSLQAHLADRLQHVVEGAGFERVNGVLVVCCDDQKR